MNVSDVLTPLVVSVLVVPVVSYTWDRRKAQAQGAFEARRGLYESVYRALARYTEYVRQMRPNAGPLTNSRPSDDPILSEELNFALRLHASPVMLAYVDELLVALDESKGQSWHREEMRRQMESATDRTERRRLAGLMFQHDNLKVKNDDTAKQCLAQLRHRIRWELYGWRQIEPYWKRRIRLSVKRSQSRRTEFFTGGVDHSSET